MAKNKGNSYKKIPKYWWNFVRSDGEHIDHVVIKSDHKKYPILARIKINNRYADKEIEEAEQLIDDLKSGRKSPKNIVRKFNL